MKWQQWCKASNNWYRTYIILHHLQKYFPAAIDICRLQQEPMLQQNTKKEDRYSQYTRVGQKVMSIVKFNHFNLHFLLEILRVFNKFTALKINCKKIVSTCPLSVSCFGNDVITGCPLEVKSRD